MNQWTNNFWSTERVEELTQLRARGLSAAQIARIIGASRCAILGKLSRLNVPNPNGKFWSLERVARAKQLFEQGLSISLIAEEIGTTKNAVIGKFDRLGITAPPDRKTIFRTNRRSGVREKAKRPSLARPTIKPRLRDIPAPNEQFKCTLFDLANDTCRWPLWGNDPREQKFYCGTPEADCANGRPYCRWHSALGARRSEMLEVPFR